MYDIDLYSARFWLFVGLVLIILVPIQGPRFRKFTLALLNVSFLYLHLYRSHFLAACGLLFVCWVVLRLLSTGRARTALAVVGGLSLFLLFAIHKVSYRLPVPGMSGLKLTLATIGFSYVVLRLYEVGDAVRTSRHTSPDLASLVNYLIPFHMLAAGPIQSYDDFAAQPPSPSALSFGRSLEAIERIAMGLSKKYILANLLERMLLTNFRTGLPYFFLEVQFTYLWLYLDFSAYSDVAVGVGQLIGVRTPENFNRPYLARNIIDFWERWHISLSQFIRRNVFIPIQLTLMRRFEGRSPMLIASVAFTISFGLCGLWHSISVCWLAWGLYNSAGLIGCSVYKQFLLKRFGRKGLNRYLANPWIHALAVFLTFEFIAVSFTIVTFPFLESVAWIKGSPLTSP